MVRTESVIVRDNIRASQPTVLLIVGTEPLEPLLTFFREKCMSLSAERSYAQAVGRFVEWLSVRAGEFYAQDQRNLLYTAFVHDLRFGTYREGIDQYGLNWLPISDGNLRRLSRCLVEFSDWLCQRHGATPLIRSTTKHPTPTNWCSGASGTSAKQLPCWATPRAAWALPP